MTDPVFDKEGNLSNLDELTREEVASAYQEKNRQLFGRISDEEQKRKQAEADKAKAEQERDEVRRAAQPPAAPAQAPVQPPVQQPQTDPEELRAVARGYSDEEITEAKSIAKGKGISLGEALETNLFKLWKSDADLKRKKEDAKLGGSSGSGDVTPKEGLKPGLSRDDHKVEWQRRMRGEA